MPPLPPCVAAFLCVDFWRRAHEHEPAAGRKGKRSLVGKASFVWRRGPSEPRATAPTETLLRGEVAPIAPEVLDVPAAEAADADAAPEATDVPEAPEAVSPTESRPADGSTPCKAETELPYASPADAAPTAPPDDDYTEPGTDAAAAAAPNAPDAPYLRPADQLPRTGSAEEPYYAVPVQQPSSEHSSAQPLPPPRRRQRAT